jgi:hypothetical protein
MAADFDDLLNFKAIVYNLQNVYTTNGCVRLYNMQYIILYRYRRYEKTMRLLVV